MSAAFSLTLHCKLFIAYLSAAIKYSYIKQSNRSFDTIFVRDIYRFGCCVLVKYSYVACSRVFLLEAICAVFSNRLFV